MIVLGDTTVLQDYSVTDADDASDVFEFQVPPHQLHHTLIVVDVPTNGCETMIGLPGNIHFVLTPLMQRADQSFVSGVASLVGCSA
jgi:hypothetical protein